jgi:arylsulfatase A-like enzyme
VFRELIRVPLVLAGPGVPRQRFRGQVRLLDVAPTLIGLAGIEASNHRFEGVALGPALAASTSPEQRTALSETWTSESVQRSVRDDRYQMLRLGERELLFDRGSRSFVPLEAHADEVMRLRAALDSTLAGIRRAPTAPLVLDPELAERLRALGYAQ